MGKKDKKELNPADSFRKEMRKKELVKTKKDRNIKREVRTLLNDPEKIDEEIERTQRLSEENLLDKSLKDRIRELKMMKSVAVKKKLVDIAVGRVKPDQQESIHESNSSGQTRDRNVNPNEHHAAINPNTRRIESASAVVEQKPENSVYFHPVHNPTGAPPPGQPPLYVAKPSQQPSIPSSNAVAIGGQNGIPLPPPRPPPFPGSLPPFLVPPQNSMIPPPPYPYPLPFPFGGVSVIPPPPPLQAAHIFPVHPMSMAAGMNNPYSNNSGHVQSSLSTPAESMSSNKRRREIKGSPADFDPLDPSAAGYVERFGRQKSQPHNEEFLQPTAPVIESWEATHAGKILNTPVIGIPTTAQPPPPPLPPATLAETITTSVEFSSGERPNQLGGFKILTAEELMRRRHQISTEEPPLTVDGPSFLGADVGPSMPAPIEYSTASEIDSKSKDAGEKPSVLSGLITYDSDSDQSDGGEVQEDDNENDNYKTYPYSYANMAYPSVTVENTVSYPTTSTADYFSFASAPASIAPSIAPVSSSVQPSQQLVGSSLISGPKIIKADKALTAFVPNVLKQKKQTSTVTTSSSSGTMAISLQMKSAIEAKPSLSTATLKPTASIAVDDAYKQFFEELNVLGAI